MGLTFIFIFIFYYYYFFMVFHRFLPLLVNEVLLSWHGSFVAKRNHVVWRKVLILLIIFWSGVYGGSLSGGFERMEQGDLKLKIFYSNLYFSGRPLWAWEAFFSRCYCLGWVYGRFQIQVPMQTEEKGKK